MAQECSVIMSAMMCHMRSNPKHSQSSPQSVARANRISACPNLGCDCDTVRFFLRCLKASQSHPKGDFFAAFWSSFWKCTSCSWVSRHRAALKIVTPLMRTAVLQRCQSDKFSKNCSRRLYTLFVALLHICYAVFMNLLEHFADSLWFIPISNCIIYSTSSIVIIISWCHCL